MPTEPRGKGAEPCSRCTVRSACTGLVPFLASRFPKLAREVIEDAAQDTRIYCLTGIPSQLRTNPAIHMALLHRMAMGHTLRLKTLLLREVPIRVNGDGDVALLRDGCYGGRGNAGLVADRFDEEYDFLDSIREAAMKLPSKQRVYFEAVHARGMSPEGLAKKLGVSLGSVRTALSRAEKRVRRIVKEDAGVKKRG